MPSDPTYCIVSPCRDEGEFLTKTLNSVAKQTVTPDIWVIVNDGSTDNSLDLLRSRTESIPWIRVVDRPDRGERSVGPGVVDAFYAGYRSVAELEWRYLCKLDMDLELPERYFETLIGHMRADTRLGSISGQAYFEDADTGDLVSERISPEMSVGASKFYRRECFEQIGGLVRAVMWDGIDCHRARMLGWKVRTFDEEDTRFLHLRPMGSSQRGILSGRMRWGYGQWFMGTSFAYLSASALYRMTRPPLILGGLAIWWGYLHSALGRKPRLHDPAFRKFLRRYQWRMLLRGKRRATEVTEAEQESAWAPSAGPRWHVPLEVAAEPRLP